MKGMRSFSRAVWCFRRSSSSYPHYFPRHDRTIIATALDGCRRRSDVADVSKAFCSTTTTTTKVDYLSKYTTHEGGKRQSSENAASTSSVSEMMMPEPSSSSSRVSVEDSHTLSAAPQGHLPHFQGKVDVGKFFRVDPSAWKVGGCVPEGFTKKWETTLAALPYPHWMLREKTKKILWRLKEWPRRASAMPPAMVLDGESGTGKSVALMQIVEFCRVEGWIVLYVPKGRSWCYDAPYLEESKVYKGKFDLGDVVKTTLEHFLSAHGNQLEELELSATYEDYFAPYDRSFQGTTLQSLVQFGISYPEATSAVMVLLRKELNKVTKFPILIAVDEYNWWHYDTIFGYEGRNVHPQDILPVNALSSFHSENSSLRGDNILKNGIFIGATTENFTTRFHLDEQIDYKKYRQTFQPYSEKELDSVMNYYRDSGFTFEPVNFESKTAMRFLTKSIPERVFKTSCYM